MFVWGLDGRFDGEMFLERAVLGKIWKWDWGRCGDFKSGVSAGVRNLG